MDKPTLAEELFPTLRNLHVATDLTNGSIEYSKLLIGQHVLIGQHEQLTLQARIEIDHIGSLLDRLDAIARLRSKWIGLTVATVLVTVLCAIAVMMLAAQLVAVVLHAGVVVTCISTVMAGLGVNCLAAQAYGWLLQNIIYDPLTRFSADDWQHAQRRGYLAEAKQRP